MLSSSLSRVWRYSDSRYSKYGTPNPVYTATIVTGKVSEYRRPVRQSSAYWGMNIRVAPQAPVCIASWYDIVEWRWPCMWWTIAELKASRFDLEAYKEVKWAKIWFWQPITEKTKGYLARIINCIEPFHTKCMLLFSWTYKSSRASYITEHGCQCKIMGIIQNTLLIHEV